MHKPSRVLIVTMMLPLWGVVRFQGFVFSNILLLFIACLDQLFRKESLQ